MNIDAAIATLQLDLKIVEEKLKQLLSIECTKDNQYRELLSTRQQLIDGIKCMMEGYEMYNIGKEIFKKIMEDINEKQRS